MEKSEIYFNKNVNFEGELEELKNETEKKENFYKDKSIHTKSGVYISKRFMISWVMGICVFIQVTIVISASFI